MASQRIEPPDGLRWIVGSGHDQAWEHAAHWLHDNSHDNWPSVLHGPGSPCHPCWRAAAYTVKAVVVTGYQDRDQVLTEAAGIARANCDFGPGQCGCHTAADFILAARTVS
jgi:hypothetical protein